MKLPALVLRQVRGPLLAAAVVGCSSAPAAQPAPPPAPAPPAPEVIAAPDPVSYDADAEAERLTRLDRALASAEGRRERRIDDEAESRRREQVQSALGSVLGRYPDYIHAACGRG